MTSTWSIMNTMFTTMYNECGTHQMCLLGTFHFYKYKIIDLKDDLFCQFSTTFWNIYDHLDDQVGETYFAVSSYFDSILIELDSFSTHFTAAFIDGPLLYIILLTLAQASVGAIMLAGFGFIEYELGMLNMQAIKEAFFD